MLDKIYHYAINNIENIQSSDFKQSKIGGYIHLNQAGEYQFVEIVENPEFSSFPAISNTGSSSTNILIEKLNIILGMHDAAKREAYYLGKVNECLANCNKLMPVITFLEAVRQNEELCISITESVKKGDVKLKKDLFSFKIDGDKIEEIPEIVAAMQKAIPIPADAIVGTSSITNEEKVLCSQPVKFRFKPLVKDDNYNYDFPLAPFSKSPSTGSYFQEGAIISRMGSDEVDAIKIGLETLLNDKNHYNVFFRLLHWYDEELNLHPYQQEIFNFNAFVSPESHEETNDETQEESVSPAAFDKQAADVLTAVQTADKKALGNIENNVYHVAFCYAPCKSRFKLYGHREWSVLDAKKNLDKFKEDSVIKYAGGEETITNLKKYLTLFAPSTVERTKIREFVSNTFGSNVDMLIYSIYDNKQIPVIFYRKAIDIATHYISIDSLKSDNKRYRLPHYLNAMKTIKLYINRRENNMQYSKAYYCGRVFSVYEEIQKRATNGNSVSNLFGMAKQYPLRVFDRISPLAKHHLDKSSMRNTGFAILCQKLLDEYHGKIGTIPMTFSLEERGDFIAGYHDQHTEFYTKKEGDNNNG